MLSIESNKVLRRTKEILTGPKQTVGDVAGYMGSMTFEHPSIVGLMDAAKASISNTALEEVTAHMGGIAVGQKVGLSLESLTKNILTGYHSPSGFTGYVDQIAGQVVGPLSEMLTSGIIAPPGGGYYSEKEINFFTEHIKDTLRRHGAATYTAGMLASTSRPGMEPLYSAVEAHAADLTISGRATDLLSDATRILRGEDPTVSSNIGRIIDISSNTGQSVEAAVSGTAPVKRTIRAAESIIRITDRRKKSYFECTGSSQRCCSWN